VSTPLLVHPDKRPVRRANGLFRLGLREFSLMVGILGGILALVGVIFLASASYH